MALGLGGAGREYVLKIVADVTGAVKGVDEVADKTTTMKDKMLGVGKAVATGLAVGAVVEFGKATINAAAEADDGADAIAAAFGKSSDEIAQFSKKSAENMGMSTAAYQQMVSVTGSLLQSLGLSSDDAAKSTEVLSQRAADMAAIFGGDTNKAMDAINKALKGSTRSLAEYGVAISASEIDSRAMAKGYVDASGKVTDAGKAIAAQELILEKTSNVQGAWAANSKDLGSQQAILGARMEDLQASIGEKLLPVIVSLMSYLQPLLNFVAANAGWLAPLAGMILGIAAAVKVWTIAQAILNSTLLANPIFLIVAAIAALVAGLIWAYNNVEWFRDAVDGMAKAVVAAFQWIADIAVGVFNWVKDNWPLLLAILSGPIGLAVLAIVKYWDQILAVIQGVWQWIKDYWPLLLGIITGPFGLAVALIIQNWDTVKGAVKGAYDAIVGFASDLPRRIGDALGNLADVITWPFKQAWSYISAVPVWLVDKWRWAVGAIQDMLTGIGNSISAPFEWAFNAIKRMWNATVGGFGFTVPSWIPGIGGKQFKIPEMALGGIVTRPTIAMIGERGPEAVIPLSQMSAVQPANVTINVYALTANAEVGRRVVEALNEYQRATGKAYSGA